MMNNARMTTSLALAAFALCAAQACKKTPVARDAPPPADVAVDTNEPPPPLHDAEVELEGGWKIKLRVPDGFTGPENGVFRARGNVIVVRASCTNPCETGKWLARSADVVGQEIAGYAAQDAAGNRIPPTIEYNNRVAENRYEYQVVVPRGGGLLDEPSLAGGVMLFDDAWPKYVVCEWGAAMETALTFKPALIEACKSIQVVVAPLAPPPPAPPAEAPQPPDAADEAGAPPP